MFGYTVPFASLKIGYLYSARIKGEKHDDYEMAVYKGNGEWFVGVYEEANGQKDWRNGKKLAVLKDASSHRGVGSVHATEEVGEVKWDTEGELLSWLDDSYAGPRIERMGLVNFALDYRWMSSTVIDLCRIMHDDKDFSRLPILGDALMDAGCDDEKLIAACQNEKTPAYAQRIISLLLGGQLADAVKWLENFGSKWNFSYKDMATPACGGGLVALGRDLHDDMDSESSTRYWDCVKILTGNDSARGDFYWGCSC